jgi:hypothetical protein
MRPAIGRPAAVGAEVLGGDGSGVPPQATTSPALRHSDAARSAGWAGSSGTVNTGALVRLAPTRCGPRRLSIARASPLRLSASVSAGRRRVRDRSCTRMPPVPAGMCRPGTHTRSPAGASAT